VPACSTRPYAAIRRDARAAWPCGRCSASTGSGFEPCSGRWSRPGPPHAEAGAAATRLDAYTPLIDQMPRVDLDAPRKQQHTAKRILR
jgi:hypothetical protein